MLQKKRAALQKLAEILSANVNRAVVETIAKHRLGDSSMVGLRSA